MNKQTINKLCVLIDYLESHNKNYNNKQYYNILEIQDILHDEKAKTMTKKEKFIKDFYNIDKTLCFEFKEKVIYITIEKNSFIAGSVCNVGIQKEFKHKINFDLSIEENIQNLFDYIIENSNYTIIDD